jgi:uncharacterized OB-fold protein
MMERAMTDGPVPEFAQFWRNVAERRLCFPRCRACGRFHRYPLTRCPYCLAADIEWCAVEPRGTLYSYVLRLLPARRSPPTSTSEDL